MRFAVSSRRALAFSRQELPSPGRSRDRLKLRSLRPRPRCRSSAFHTCRRLRAPAALRSPPHASIRARSPDKSSHVFVQRRQSEITAGVTYDATLTPPMETNIIGSVDLTGTVEMKVLGRASNTETGSFTVDLIELSLSGPLSLSGSPWLDGRTLMVGLDTANPSETSSGTTTIAPTARRSKSTVSSTCSPI